MVPTHDKPSALLGPQNAAPEVFRQSSFSGDLSITSELLEGKHQGCPLCQGQVVPTMGPVGSAYCVPPSGHGVGFLLEKAGLFFMFPEWSKDSCCGTSVTYIFIKAPGGVGGPSVHVLLLLVNE